ncbi:MAG: RluA family pseudouridine synthase [Myxococcota bacterium]|nr:RluA family pseudouridine synthase [Myxococcota bacterium]
MTNLSWRELIIDEKGAGQRIDVFLSRRFSKYSRSFISKSISLGEIRCPNRNIKPSSILYMGQVIQIFIPGLAPTEPPPPLPEILFEDDDLLVVNKPAGMLVHPAGDTFVWALIGLFKDARPKHCLDLVHRLDRDTSGTLLLTKNKKSNSIMKKQLQEGNINKVYQALVIGTPNWKHYDLHAPIDISPNSSIRLRRAVVENSYPSHTTFRVLQCLDNLSLVECVLHTGRTHQIRVHLEHLGYPILGDKIYGQDDRYFLQYLKKGLSQELCDRFRFPRHALHAARLQIKHPDGSTRVFESPLPSDMENIITGGAPSWTLTPK